MTRMTLSLFAITLCLSGAHLVAAQNPPPPAPGTAAPVVSKNPLVWDSIMKDYEAKKGETTNTFTFWVTNTGPQEVIVNAVSPSCGCTVAKMPATPWKIGPGENGPVVATVNFAGKSGELTKTMTVVSTAGTQSLTMHIKVPHDDDFQKRQQNMLIALQDRQAIFRNDCAECHVKKGEGKRGAELFAADCAICHEPPGGHRSEVVTDLRKINHAMDPAAWRAMIADGKGGSLMPAFSKAKGGPLTDEEIESLVEYTMKTYSTKAAVITDKPAGGTQ
jgi:mono/diheme cytochrome c family protein